MFFDVLHDLIMGGEKLLGSPSHFFLPLFLKLLTELKNALNMSAISDKKETLYFESSLFCSMCALF